MMLKTFWTCACMAILMMTASVHAQEQEVQDALPAFAKIQTDKGDIIVAFYGDDAPKTVANFIAYAKKGHYDRTIFHRVVNGFVIQGGGFSRYFNERPTGDPVPYEGDNGRNNLRGTIAMARLTDPQSARAQWYINLQDNEDLDHKIVQDLPLYGYTVFGEVVAGMEIADEIGAVSTGPGGPFEEQVPIDPIVILRVDPTEWSAAE